MGKAINRKTAFRPRSVELDITAIGARGDGLAKWEGEQVFVPLTVPGDRVVARLEGRRGDGLIGGLTEILRVGPARRQPPCPLFGRCGGCSLQHLDGDSLTEWKRDRLVAALTRAGFDSGCIEPLVVIPPGRRRRASLAFTRSRNAVILGFNERSSHRLIDIDPCLLLAPPLLALLAPLRALLADCITIGGHGDVVVTDTDSGLDVVIQNDAGLDLFARERLARFAEDCDLARLSWQRGQDAEPVAHRRPALVKMGDVAVAIPPGSFLQPSREGEAALVALARRHLPAAGPIADLYAGCGSFTFPVAEGGRAVHAVEGDKLAVDALSHAARHSGLAVTSELRDLVRRPLLAAELKPYGAVLFDPPRAGAAAQAEILAKSGPDVVVAISCNPATLARDAVTLASGGYRLVVATPVDQFTWSSHLEAVATFRR